MKKVAKDTNKFEDFPILLSVCELEAMGMGRSMAYKLLGSDKLPRVAIGKRCFLLRDEFYEWLKSGGDSSLTIDDSEDDA